MARFSTATHTLHDANGFQAKNSPELVGGVKAPVGGRRRPFVRKIQRRLSDAPDPSPNEEGVDSSTARKSRIPAARTGLMVISRGTGAAAAQHEHKKEAAQNGYHKRPQATETRREKSKHGCRGARSLPTASPLCPRGPRSPATESRSLRSRSLHPSRWPATRPSGLQSEVMLGDSPFLPTYGKGVKSSKAHHPRQSC